MCAQDSGKRNLRLLVSYDGTAFCGMQYQPRDPSIQDELEKALVKLFGPLQERLTAAGRTDAGVHALGQVVNLHVKDPGIPLSNIKRALNMHLPEDIRIRSVSWADDEFSARFSATGKTYAYAILNRPRPSVFWRRRAFHVPWRLDLDAMRRCADLFIGEHDFSMFSVSLEEGMSTVRRVDSISFRSFGPYMVMVFRGPGFLRGMVRMLAGAIIGVGQGRMSLDTVREMLHQARGNKITKAPAWGLYLVRVRY